MFLHFYFSIAVRSAPCSTSSASASSARRGERVGRRRRLLPRLHALRDQPAPRRAPAGDRAGAGRAARAAASSRPRPGVTLADGAGRCSLGSRRWRAWSATCGPAGWAACDQLLRLGRGHLDPAGGGHADPRVPQLRLDLRLFELAGPDPVDPDVEIFIEGASTASGGRAVECTTCCTSPTSSCCRPGTGWPTTPRSRWPSCATSTGWTTTSPAGRAGRSCWTPAPRPATRPRSPSRPTTTRRRSRSWPRASGSPCCPGWAPRCSRPGCGWCRSSIRCRGAGSMLRARDAVREHPAVVRVVELLQEAAGES